MSVAKFRTRPRVSVLTRRSGVNRAAILLLIALVLATAACQGTPAATEQWIPSYLEMNLYSGTAQLQWPGESQWTDMEGKASLTIREGGRISTDAANGAKFFLGDGSTLELDPGTTIEVQNPRTFPRLQMIVENGSILFFAQKPSYEFALPTGRVALLSVPSLIKVEVTDEVTRLAVEEGAVTFEMETETLTLPTCRQMVVRPGAQPEISDFCTLSTVVAPPTATSSPSPTPPGFVASATPPASPTPTTTPTRRGTPTTPAGGNAISTPTYTPAPPTPEPPSSKPKNTKPPPTQVPQPTAKPTDPPPPPTAKPTEPRPTVEPPKPTPEPPQPTPEPPKPTAEPSQPTPEPPKPTAESAEPPAESP